MSSPSLPQATDTPVPDARGINLYRADPMAAALFATYLPAPLMAHLAPHFDRLGKLAGGHLDELASVADKNPPTLSVRSRTGLDESRIEKHPAYVEMERLGFAEFGLAALSHRGGVLGWPQAMPPAAKYALTYLFVQAEFGLCCPISMTDSLARTLRKFGEPALVERFLPMLTSLDFDELHQGAMFMTEQGAGSDVGATTTQATLQADGSWQLTGDKWFCSNADAGLAMVLARSEDAPGLKGISLFLLPRDLPDGTHNRYRILRLKDKLGTRSMASGEIRLEGAQAYLVGQRGRGFKHMADMINNSRLSNGVRAAGLMRRALTEAMHVARHRVAFGRTLIELPLMQRQLLKMMTRTEQARTMVFQTAAALERADRGADPQAPAPALARILTPLIKFRACRDARKVTGDAMEVRGGCGYIEEWSDPRVLRDAHLGSIWEGTSNIVALDVLRAIQREKSLPALRDHVTRLLAEGRPCDASVLPVQTQAIERCFDFAERAAAADHSHLARQAASALYHVVTLAGLRWEAARDTLEGRALLADLVLAHRLAPRDPLVDNGAETDPRYLSLLKTAPEAP
ncbi:MAG: acyl-CoA dehydrogenase family protein [Burkholderiaceae bacterium]|nr:acyl-CoA dehydrogenase family protein [Burkholderiaceae bacterium]